MESTIHETASGDNPVQNVSNGVAAMASANGNRSTKPKRIIYVDDNAPLGDLLVQHLVLAGHSAIHAADGIIAWEHISKDMGYFDLVITDNEMPELNGLELVELLREANYGGRIIVYSSALHDRDIEKYRALKVDAIVAKGTDVSVLLAAVRALDRD